MYLPTFHKFLYDEFEKNPHDENTIAKINVFMVNILNTKKVNQITENFKMVYEAVSKISNGDTVRRLYFATAVFALFLCEILIKFYTQWQF